MVFASAPTPSRAADYTKVGVRVGDTADYVSSITGKNYTRLHILVYGLTAGTVVTLELTYYDSNGKQYPWGTVTGDTYLGSGYIFYYLVAPNLVEDEGIFHGASYTINETTTLTVAGVSRSVNHLRLDGFYYLDIYWDQSTGIVVKCSIWFIGWTNLTMTSTSLWSAGLSSTQLLIIGGAVVVMLVAVAYYVGRRRGRRKK